MYKSPVPTPNTPVPNLNGWLIKPTQLFWAQVSRFGGRKWAGDRTHLLCRLISFQTTVAKKLACESQWVKWKMCKQSWDFRTCCIHKVKAMRHWETLPSVPAMSVGDVSRRTHLLCRFWLISFHMQKSLLANRNESSGRCGRRVDTSARLEFTKSKLCSTYAICKLSQHVPAMSVGDVCSRLRSLWSMSPCRMKTAPGFSPWGSVMPKCSTWCLALNSPINKLNQHLFVRAGRCREWCPSGRSEIGRCSQLLLFQKTDSWRSSKHKWMRVTLVRTCFVDTVDIDWYHSRWQLHTVATNQSLPANLVNESSASRVAMNVTMVTTMLKMPFHAFSTKFVVGAFQQHNSRCV